MTTVQRRAEDVEVSASDLEERLALLQGISIFFTLPDREVRRLAHKLHKRSAQKGTEVVHQGVVSDAMYVIVHGRCEVRASWPPKHSVTVALLAPGDFFGISAMKEGAAQPASVTALEDSELLELLTVDIDTVLRPGSPSRVEMEKLVGQEIRCRIIKLDITDEDVVVDRRALAEEEERATKDRLYGQIKEGDTISATVRSLTDYGAFVDVGGVDALLHVGDIAWGRINKPADVLSVGQQFAGRRLALRLEATLIHDATARRVDGLTG